MLNSMEAVLEKRDLFQAMVAWQKKVAISTKMPMMRYTLGDTPTLPLANKTASSHFRVASGATRSSLYVVWC